MVSRFDISYQSLSHSFHLPQNPGQSRQKSNRVATSSNHGHVPRPKVTLSDRAPPLRKRQPSTKESEVCTSLNNSGLNSSSSGHSTYDRELRSIMKSLKSSESLPKLTQLKRLSELIKACKTAAFEFQSILQMSMWKQLKSWACKSSLSSKPEAPQIRNLLLEIMTEVLRIGYQDITKD